MGYSVALFVHILPQFLPALSVTVRLAVGSSLAAAVAGLGLALIRVAGWRLGSSVVSAYVEVLRNTPLLVQMFFVFFGLPFIGIRISPFAAAWIAIAVQHSASFSEIYRAGIGSVSQRNRESARALGLGYWKSLRLVVLPLAIVKVLPALTNEVIQIIKDTSVASTIALGELTLQAGAIEEQTAATSVVFVAVACYYLVLTGVVNVGARYLEQRLRYVE
ncbi:MAG: amino acid ABC transporter permease [Vulcanimicrobiaceae bacterium]